MKIVQPDGSTWQQWTYSMDSPAYYSASAWIWSANLPAEPQAGIWKWHRERSQRSEPAGAAAADHQPLRVGVATIDQMVRTGDHIVDVGDPPVVIEQLSIGAAKTGAAAVIDVEESEPPAGPKLNRKTECRRCSARRATMTTHNQRRQFTGRCCKIMVCRWVVKTIRRRVSGCRKLDRLRLRQKTRIEVDHARIPQNRVIAGCNVELHVKVWRTQR